MTLTMLYKKVRYTNMRIKMEDIKATVESRGFKVLKSCDLHSTLKPKSEATSHLKT
jgi:uncharacterized protein (DUF302 family)